MNKKLIAISPEKKMIEMAFLGPLDLRMRTLIHKICVSKDEIGHRKVWLVIDSSQGLIDDLVLNYFSI